jgi:putative ABC transport system substrate-binding protein
MRRREFIVVMSGALLGAPSARAQQSATPAIGFLRSTSLEHSAHLMTAFREGLNQAGFAEGRNVVIEFRSAEDRLDRIPALVGELLRRQAAVLVVNTPADSAAKAATTEVPIVFATGGDPVRDGLVPSLSRPGGNVTGVVFFNRQLGTKRLEMLRQIVPKATTIGVLLNPDIPDPQAQQRDVRTAAQAMDQQLVVLNVSSRRDIETAFAEFVRRRVDAVLVGSGAFLNSHREHIVALAAAHALPTSYVWREAAVAGGLMSYGPSITGAYRQVGIYAGRILKGEKPGDLPVMQSTNFEFVVNLKTARTLGLEIPSALLALADEVIE